MTDYTPTTEHVREGYAEEIRQAKEEAWQEGLLSAGLDLDYTLQIMGTNPYAEEP